MIALGIDTAGPVLGAAQWHRARPLLSHISTRQVRGADSFLLPVIADLLANAGDDLTRVAVSIGPGAFTGLRVGVAAALGVAFARSLPVVAVSSLRARAAGVPGEPLVLALLDGRRGKVYAGRFDTTVFPPRRRGDETDAPPAWPDTRFVATGEGAAVYGDQIAAAGGSLAQDPTACPAAQVARLAWAPDAAPLAPEQVRLNYIRPPDARLPAPSG